MHDSMTTRINIFISALLSVCVPYSKVYGNEADDRELFPSENTVYLLKTDIDLKGQTIKIPKGCELRYDGGSIVNGTIEGDETILSGTGQDFIDCRLAGSFKNADIGFFKHKRNLDLARIRNLTVNGDCEIEVEETKSPSILQTITGNNHTVTLKWVKPKDGEHGVFNISGEFSMSDLKIAVTNVSVDKQTHRPAIFRTTSNGYDIHFTNIGYYGNVLFHKIYLDVNHLFETPSYIYFNNVKLETDNSTDEYFLIEYIDRSNFYKPDPYAGEINFKGCSFITNSDNAYAPISIQMPYNLTYEECIFQRNSRNKVCSLETIVPNALFRNCTMTNVGFVDNNSCANYINCQSFRIENCEISQSEAFKNINTRMRVMYYSDIDIQNSHFIINGSYFSIDAFDKLSIRNCKFDMTEDCSLNQGISIYRSYPGDLGKNRLPYITIDNLAFRYMGKNPDSINCLFEFDEKMDGVDLRKHLKIKNLTISGFDGRQFIQFYGKAGPEKLFWNENIKALEFSRNRWKKRF